MVPNAAILWQWDLRTVRSPVVTPTKLQVRFKITLEWSFHHTHPLFLPLWEDPASQWELLQTRTLKSGKIGLPLSLFLSAFYVCLQPASHRSSNWTLRMFYIFPSPLSCSTAKLQNSDSTRCKKSEKKKKKKAEPDSQLSSKPVLPRSCHSEFSSSSTGLLPLCRWFLLGPNSRGMLLWGSRSPKRQFLHQWVLWRLSLRTDVRHKLPWK